MPQDILLIQNLSADSEEVEANTGLSGQSIEKVHLVSRASVPAMNSRAHCLFFFWNWVGQTERCEDEMKAISVAVGFPHDNK